MTEPEPVRSTWRFGVEDGRIVVRSITNEDGVEMALPGSWAELVIESPVSVGLALSVLDPKVVALFRRETL